MKVVLPFYYLDMHFKHKRYTKNMPVSHTLTCIDHTSVYLPTYLKTSVNNVPSNMPHTNHRKKEKREKLGNKTSLNERRYEKKLQSIQKNTNTQVERNRSVLPTDAQGKGFIALKNMRLPPDLPSPATSALITTHTRHNSRIT